MKKLFLFLMAVISLCLTARGADGDQFTVDNLKYTVLSEADRTVQIQGYVTKLVGEFDIPAYVTNNDVTYTVTEIGSYAFSDCPDFYAVTIPETITKIWYAAFYAAGFTSIDIPDSVVEIQTMAFKNCKKLTTVTIPRSVSVIGVKSDGTYDSNICNGCISLQDIIVDEENEHFKSVDGVLYNKDATTLYIVPAKKTGDFVILDTVKEIGNFAFSECSKLESITMPDSLTEIGNNAFHYCSSLTSITIPEGVTSIGKSPFYGCKNISWIYLFPNPSECSVRDLLYVMGTSVDPKVCVQKDMIEQWRKKIGYSVDIRPLIEATVTLDKTYLSLEEGETGTLTFKCEGGSVVVKDWSSSNPNVAALYNPYKGEVTGVSKGTAVITLTMVDINEFPHTASCLVEVSVKSGVEGISVEEGSAAEFYNLNGIRVSEDGLAPGLYIKRQGGKTEKLIVK